MYAASMNNVGVLKVLLQFGSSIGGSDKGGKTAFMVAPDKEAFVKLILEQSSSELRFSELMFKGAIECDPKLGKAILDEFVIERGRYNFEFRELDRIYGKGEVHESALYSIMHLDTAEPEAKESVKQYCLQHPMIRRVLQLKWEQFLMYALLLMSSIISGSFYQLDEAPRNVLKELEDFFQPDWTSPPIPVVTGVDGTITEQVDSSGFRLALSGDYTGLDWSQQIPDMKKWKNHALNVLFLQSIFWTGVFGIPLFAYVATRTDAQINASKDLIQIFQNIVLWLAAGYFFRWEVKEMMGYGVRNYFTSVVNSMQIITFCVILFFYVPCQLQIIPETVVPRQTQLVCSGFTTLSLWVLFLQFLEIIPSAGYLLPMMKGLMRDLTRFSILYGGLTCCYYILFQSKPGHETLLKSFITVFLVLFGQLDQVVDVIESEKDKQPLLYVVGYILLMFHCAAAIVLLLNVLIAMMNVTMQMGLENARIEALVSYAHCILRLELSLQPQERLEMIYIIKPKFLKDLDPATLVYGTDTSSLTLRSVQLKNVAHQQPDESQPLVCSGSEQEESGIKPNAVGILNPAFYDKTPKSEYAPLVEIPDNSTVQFQNDVKAALATIKKEHAQQLHQLKVQIAELTKSIADFQATTAPSGMVSM
ncbi:hypothetical protein DYB36_008074 [Aphanomyces astaci]|uniref:Uncharacterized protein n=1 Tax=Aphanomyces astaci TaxID=112090 RepID=A0A397AUC6_APHAT|nr:hypothetical protein DYB36_008074 [Aphanomyces astaci]